MAQYKVPQDVEADDKLIGPFSFRQFIYLVVVAGLGGLAFLFFRVFPLLVIIPIPFMIFFAILAFPLKKDQPMETYLSAIVSFYMKPRTRTWTPGQGETTIVITAPKHTDEIRTKGLSEEEASHRLSFLADIVDTEGYAIKDGGRPQTALHSDFYGEASTTKDMFETAEQNQIYQTLDNSAQIRHNQLINQMRNAINYNTNFTAQNSNIITHNNTLNNTPPIPPVSTPQQFTPPIQTSIQASTASQTPNQFSSPVPPQLPPQPSIYQNPAPQPQTSTTPTLDPFDAKAHNPSSAIIQPDDHILESISQSSAQTTPTPQPSAPPSQEFIDLANNTDFTIETIAKQAKRIEEKNNDINKEVYISLD